MVEDKQLDFKVWQDDNGIVIGEILTRMDLEASERFIKEMLEATRSVKRKVKVFIDISKTPGNPSIRSRKLFIGFGKELKIDRLAVFGFDTLKRVMANFIMAAIGEKILKENVREMKFFGNKEEALKWLKEE